MFRSCRGAMPALRGGCARRDSQELQRRRLTPSRQSPLACAKFALPSARTRAIDRSTSSPGVAHEEDSALHSTDGGLRWRDTERRSAGLRAGHDDAGARRDHRIQHPPHQLRDGVAGAGADARRHREVRAQQRCRAAADAVRRQPGIGAEELRGRLRVRRFRHLAARPRRRVDAGPAQRPPDRAVRPRRRRPEGVLRPQPDPARCGRADRDPEGRRLGDLRLGRDRRRRQRHQCARTIRAWP